MFLKCQNASLLSQLSFLGSPPLTQGEEEQFGPRAKPATCQESLSLRPALYLVPEAGVPVEGSVPGGLEAGLPSRPSNVTWDTQEHTLTQP